MRSLQSELLKTPLQGSFLCIINNEGNIKKMTLDYYKKQLKETAEKLSEFKKGILAVDESTKTIGKTII